MWSAGSSGRRFSAIDAKFPPPAPWHWPCSLDLQMTPAEFLQLPFAVKVAFAVLVWPAVWAAVSAALALGGDIIRNANHGHPFGETVLRHR